MKNIQVIDGADNTEYALYAMTDEEFAAVFPAPGQNVEFIEETIKRVGKEALGNILKEVWKRRVEKPDVHGIHGTLFYELRWKARYYPTRNDREMVFAPSPSDEEKQKMAWSEA